MKRANKFVPAVIGKQGTNQKNIQVYYNTFWKEVVEENQRLRDEYKKTEYLYFKSSDPIEREELRLNMIDI